MAKSRVLAIGIDSASWDDVHRFIDAGDLPNIAEHLGDSAIASFSGDLAYRAEASWTEFLTARPAAANKYWTTAEFDPSTYEVWEVGSYRGSPFYARQDLEVICFDIPHSMVSPEVIGSQIVAWGAHSPQSVPSSKPSDLMSRIEREFGMSDMPLNDSQIGWHNERYQRSVTDAIVDGLRKKADICGWLAEQSPNWDLFCTVLSETHVAGHCFYHGVSKTHPLVHTDAGKRAAEYFRETLLAVDDAVGAIVERVADENTTVVLFAVHGTRDNGSDVSGLVLLPELLHRLEFGEPFMDFPSFLPEDDPVLLDPMMRPSDYYMRLLTAPKGTMYGTPAARLKNRVALEVRERLPEEALAKVERMWRRVSGRTNDWTALVTREPTPERPASIDYPRKPLDYYAAAWYCDFWPRMKAFALPSFSDAHIRVNLRGRERDGVVDPADYSKTLDELEATLRSLTDARTGRPLVDEIVRMREDDPFDPDGPTGDLVVMFHDATDALRHPEVGVVGPSPYLRSGEHTPDGWAAFRPPGGASGDVGVHRVHDLAPTLVDLLGRPPAPQAIGKSFADRLAG